MDIEFTLESSCENYMAFTGKRNDIYVSAMIDKRMFITDWLLCDLKDKIEKEIKGIENETNN